MKIMKESRLRRGKENILTSRPKESLSKENLMEDRGNGDAEESSGPEEMWKPYTLVLDRI